MLRRIIVILIAVIVAFGFLLCTSANAKNKDKTIVKAYVTEKYNMPVKFVKDGSSLVEQRKGKPYVVVEIINTTAKGGWWGKTKGNFKIKYNKKEKKGRKVKVYLVYNPKTNVCDDVVLKVDHGKKKPDSKKKQKMHCPYCGTGTSENCVYYYYDAQTGKSQHMTPQEIKEFEWLESHYQDENGEWKVR